MCAVELLTCELHLYNTVTSAYAGVLRTVPLMLLHTKNLVTGFFFPDSPTLGNQFFLYRIEPGNCSYGQDKKLLNN